MKKIRARLRKLRHKLARVFLAIETADRRIHFHYKRARQARDNAQKLRRKGQISRSDKANGRANYHQNKAQAWERRKRWLRDKHIYLQLLRDKNNRRKHTWIKNHPEPEPETGAGFQTVDGKEVPNWIANVALAARKAGAWHGYIFSGFRSPAYSTSLCMGYCGRPTCVNCGGANSNHSAPPTHTGKEYEGAVDATDAGNLRAYAQNRGIPLNNHLPGDYPHSSASGY